MNFTDKVSSLLLGAVLGCLLASSIVIGVLLKASIEQKRDLQAEQPPIETALYSLEVKKLATSDAKEIAKANLQILSKQTELRELLRKIEHTDEFVSFLHKTALGLLTFLGLVVAIINMNYKYLHRLHSIITIETSGSKKAYRVSLLNKKDRNEVLIGAYLKGGNGEVIELIKLSDSPEKIDSFGFFSKEFTPTEDIGSINPNNYFKVYAILSDGDQLKCPAVMLFKANQATRVIPQSSIRAS